MPDPGPAAAERTVGRLLYVITSLDYGGAEALVVELAARFAERGWKVGVVSMVTPRAYEAQLEAANVELFSLDMRPGLPDPRAIAHLARIYRQFQPDVVHAHMVHANLLARVARLAGPLTCLVCTAHNINEGGAHLYLGYRMTASLSEVTTNVSRSAVERHIELGVVRREKSAYIPNGINLRRFSRNLGDRERLRAELGAADSFVWLTVGRITEQKDYPNLLAALSSQDSSSLLWLVGDGELRQATEAQVKELGLSERVRFLGLRSDVGALMSAADGFVLGSAWEGLPITLLEAAASGLPAVATEVGGVAEIVKPGTGWLVPPRDPAALAQAMNELESAPVSRRLEMGDRARGVALAGFDITSVVNQWEALFGHLLASAGGRAARRAHRFDAAGLNHALTEAAAG